MLRISVKYIDRNSDKEEAKENIKIVSLISGHM